MCFEQEVSYVYTGRYGVRGFLECVRLTKELREVGHLASVVVETFKG